MRKALLLSLILVLPAVTARGQGKRKQYRPSDQTSAGAIKFGLKLGPSNFGTQRKGDKLEDLTNCQILRFHAGAFGEYKFIDKVGLQLALLYSGQGRQDKLDSYLPDREGKGEVKKLKLNYLLAASTLRWYPGADRQFCLFIGPYLGYCMSAMEYPYIDGKQQEPGVDLKASPDPIKNLDLGIVLGLDYEFAMGLILGFANNTGLKNLFDNLEAKNFGGQFSVGYNFAKHIQ